MYSTVVSVGSTVGLHARPAGIIAEAVAAAGIPVTLAVDGGAPVDAGSTLMIMTLGAGHGTIVTVTGEDRATVDRIAELVATDLDG